MNPVTGVSHSLGATPAKNLQNKSDTQNDHLRSKTSMTGGYDKTDLSPEAKKLSKIAGNKRQTEENHQTEVGDAKKTFSTGSPATTISPNASGRTMTAASRYQSNDSNSPPLSLRHLLDQTVTGTQADHYRSLISIS